MSKPFFFRLEPLQLMTALIQIPEAERGAWITKVSIELATGNAESDFAKALFVEAEKFKANASERSRIAGLASAEKRKQKPTDVQRMSTNVEQTSTDVEHMINSNQPSKQLAVNNSSNNERKEKLLLPSEAFQLFQKYAGVAQIGGGQAAMIKELVELFTRETIEEAFRAAAAANISVHGFLNWSRKRMERQPEAPQESASDRMLRELEEEESRGK